MLIQKKVFVKVVSNFVLSFFVFLGYKKLEIKLLDKKLFMFLPVLVFFNWKALKSQDYTKTIKHQDKYLIQTFYVVL